MRTLIILFAIFALTKGIELTFELNGNSEQCFYEDLKNDIETVIEFQLITSGEIDARVEDPYGNVILLIHQVPRHKFEFKTITDGAYKLCVINRFSTVSYSKIVYIQWDFANQIPKTTSTNQIPSIVPAMHISLDYLYNRLRTIDYYQTHHRLKEAIGRKRVENLSNFISYTSIWNMVLILIIGFAEVIIVRSFFGTEKTDSFMKSARRAFRTAKSSY